jgi:hypothetical protein
MQVLVEKLQKSFDAAGLGCSVKNYHHLLWARIFANIENILKKFCPDASAMKV